MKGYWTCQRTADGIRCRAVNPNRKRKCERCQKPRPTRKPPAHMAALDLPYEHYVAINGGNFCGICRKAPAAGQKFHRDHEHKGDGTARGVLCFPCNLQLKHTSTIEWLRSAADYLERAAAHASRPGCNQCGALMVEGAGLVPVWSCSDCGREIPNETMT